MANQVLDEGGWTLAADGSEWDGTGLRYKEVTAEQAENYEDYCVNVDGKILMPLRIEWASSEGNAVSDLIATMLVKGNDITAAGMQINQATMDFSALLSYLYRQDQSGTGGDYTIPAYGMFNLASTFENTVYDAAYSWTGDPDMVAQGFNSNYLFDLGEGGLDDLSMRMVYGVDPPTRRPTWRSGSSTSCAGTSCCPACPCTPTCTSPCTRIIWRTQPGRLLGLQPGDPVRFYPLRSVIS